jgi:hypothetical protein
MFRLEEWERRSRDDKCTTKRSSDIANELILPRKEKLNVDTRFLVIRLFEEIVHEW